MRLYWCKNFKDKGKSRELLALALRDYMNNMLKVSKMVDEVKIVKGSHGKPYTSIPGVHFNISHSQNLWVCGVSNRPIGVDVEIVRPRDYKKLVDKYFQREEVLYVKERGLAGFFDIWTWKEAHSKLLGESIFKNLGLSAVSNGKIKTYSIHASNVMNEELDADRFGCLNRICIMYRTGVQLSEIMGRPFLNEISCTVAKVANDLSENICIDFKEIDLQ